MAHKRAARTLEQHKTIFVYSSIHLQQQQIFLIFCFYIVSHLAHSLSLARSTVDIHIYFMIIELLMLKKLVIMCTTCENVNEFMFLKCSMPLSSIFSHLFKHTETERERKRSSVKFGYGEKTAMGI